MSGPIRVSSTTTQMTIQQFGQSTVITLRRSPSVTVRIPLDSQRQPSNGSAVHRVRFTEPVEPIVYDSSAAEIAIAALKISQAS